MSSRAIQSDAIVSSRTIRCNAVVSSRTKQGKKNIDNPSIAYTLFLYKNTLIRTPRLKLLKSKEHFENIPRLKQEPICRVDQDVQEFLRIYMV